MKNIHVLPTDKPSYLYKKSDGTLHISDLFEGGNSAWKNQNIYITSDEEIKEGWSGYAFKEDVEGKVFKHFYTQNEWYKDAKKIILTDNQHLIKDGVQAIDDEFLEWFVKNPSCEWVKVIYEPKNYLDIKQGWEYEIIIPKEELKQEILPELVNIPMMVSMDGKNWKKRNVIALSKGIYVTSNSIKTDADTDEEFRSIDYWKFAKPI